MYGDTSFTFVSTSMQRMCKVGEKGIVSILKDKRVMSFATWQVALFLTGCLVLSGLTYYYFSTTTSLLEERRELEDMLKNKEEIEKSLVVSNDKNTSLEKELADLQVKLADSELALSKKQEELVTSNKQVVKLKAEHKKANDYIKEIETELSVIEDNFELYKTELSNFTETTGAQEGVAVFEGN